MDHISEQTRTRRSPRQKRTVHQLLVTLRGTNPLIWRRIVVPSNVLLEKLHEILQVAMGWENCHLHQFQASGVTYVMVDPEGDGTGHEVDPSEWAWGKPAAYADQTRLDRVASSVGDHLVYVYDFGDDWTHDIIAEDVYPPERDATYPICLAGSRRCPREDAGGVYGYEEMLQIIQDPDHEEYDSTVMWLGDDFEPDDFEVATTNAALRQGLPPPPTVELHEPSERLGSDGIDARASGHRPIES